MQLSTECFRLLIGDGGLYCVEPDCNTWNIVRKNTPKNPEVMILANVILGPRRDLRLYALNLLQNRPIRHFKKLKIYVMAIYFNTYQGYPKIPVQENFK